MAPRPSDRFQVARFLRMQPWFAQLAPPLQEEVIRSSHTRRFARGSRVLAAGEAPQGWHALLSGFIKLQSPPQGERPLSAFLALTGGEWFGEGTALTGEPRRYEVVALRDSELLCVPLAQFRQLVDGSLALNQAVMHHMHQRLAQTMSIIEASRHGSLEQRAALYLCRPFWHGLRKLNLCQEELGCLAGMSRQAVNRALKGLERRGLVTLHHGRVASVAQDALEHFVGLRPWHEEARHAPALLAQAAA